MVFFPELHNIIRSLEEREKVLTRKNFDVEACYYQLKSRYIMVLNHFKNPQKPGKSEFLSGFREREREREK